MKKSLILLLSVAILALAACQPASKTATAPAASPTQSVQIPAVQNAYPAATNPAAPAAAYPAGTSQSDNAMTAYPSPNTAGSAGVGSAFPPADADANMARGNFLLDSASLQASAGQPGQADLMGSGSLPTPCNQLRVKLNPPDAQNKIVVEVYSVVEKDKNCAQTLKAFQGKLATLGGYPSGKYTVVVNDKPAGELTVP